LACPILKIDCDMISILFASVLKSAMSVPEKIATVLASFAGKSIWNKIEASSPIHTRRKYLRDLRLSILNMPLLYRGLTLTVDADYVDVRIVKLDRSINEHPMRAVGQMSTSTFGLNNSFSRLIVFGTPGMGKTTLFRRATLEAIDNANVATRVVQERGLVPIFVPLKAISNHRPSPIISYILETQQYFAGSRGLKRFTKLVEQRKVFLLLDGYDEIPFIGGSDFIRTEISRLMGAAEDSKSKSMLREELSEIYSQLQFTRIWLSSRLEFYKTFPLDFGKGVGTLEVRGLPDHGIALIGRLFKHYRETFPDYVTEQLNEENFLRELILGAADSVSYLTSSPLFLTVVCHAFVHDLRERIDPMLAWKKGANAIIRRCVALLLFEIDDHKTKGLSSISKKALLDRRSAWQSEKTALLQRIAGNSYREGKTLLTSEDIMRYCRERIYELPDSEEIQKIKKGLNSDDSAVNIGSQLIFSGILLRVRGSDNKDLYDFPHRRFRELLAVDEFDTPQGAQFLAEHCLSENLFQLVLLYLESNSRWSIVLDGLCAEVVERETRKQSDSVFFAHALSRIRDRSYLHNSVCNLILNAVESNRYPSLYLTSVLEAIDLKDRNFADRLRSIFCERVADGDAEACVFIYPILLAYSPKTAVEDLSDALAAINGAPSFFLRLCSLVDGNNDKITYAALLATIGETPASFNMGCRQFIGLVWLDASGAARDRIENAFRSRFSDENLAYKQLLELKRLVESGSRRTPSKVDAEMNANLNAVRDISEGRNKIWRMSDVPPASQLTSSSQ
jgi:NACHT domain